MKRNSFTRKLVFAALLTAISLVMFVIEAAIPPLTPFPAVKLGLANTVTLFILFLGGSWKARDASMVLLARVLLSALITGQPMTLAFSFCGGIVALALMLIGRRFLGNRLIPAVSVLGAVGHNIGQTVAAYFIYNSASVVMYIPLFLLSGIISGFLTGLIVAIILKKHPRFIDLIKGN